MKASILLMLGFVCLMLDTSSCRKQNTDSLSSESQQGYNTFGCRVNGKIWLPFGVPFTSVATVAFASKKYLTFAANQGNQQSMEFVLQNEEIKIDTLYTLNFSTNSIARFEKENDKGLTCYYQTNSKYAGQLVLTKFDTINRIVSGRFSFKAQYFSSQGEKASCDTTIINITEGRFDLKYLIR